MQIEANDEFGWFFFTAPIAIGLAALAFVFTRSPPPPAPSNATVFGCYTAPDSPPILLDENGLHVRQADYPVVPFHLETSKAGIALAAGAPMRADKTANGYRFGMHKRGGGLFMPFYRVVNGHSYGVFDARHLEGFQMIAEDLVYLDYAPSEMAACA
jgi:hypothetical protein